MTGSSIAGTAEPSSAAVAEGREKFDGQAVLKKYKRRLRVEIVGLCVLMAIVWGLLTLPIIFYFSPTPVDNENGTDLIKNVTSVPFECRENFFREEHFNTCVPICPSWKQDREDISITEDVIVIVSYSTGFVTGIIIVVLSIIRRKAMFSFPNSLVIYLTIVYLIQNFFYIVTFFDRSTLYCSSKNLFITFTHVTPFCVISGMVQVYSTLASAVWWLMLTVALFWKIWFPFSARSKHQIKYIHLGCGLTGLLVPLIPIIAHMTSYAARLNSASSNVSFVSGGLGFAGLQSPPLPCNGRSKEIIFYTNILPAVIMLAIGITLITLIFWLVHKKHVLFKASQLKKKPFGLSVAERKLLIIFCYYVVSTVINMTTFSIFTNKSDIIANELDRYFMCELSGHDPANPCDRERFERIINDVPVILAFGLHGILPLVNLIFVISVQDLREKCPCVFCQKTKDSVAMRDMSTGETSRSRV